MYDKMQEDADTSIIGDAIEISSYSFPLWSGIAIAILIGGYSPIFILFPFAGLGGLILSIGISRHSKRSFTLVAWPVPKERVERVTSAIAYNSTLLLGVVVAVISWLIANSWYWGTLFALVVPIWFLRHLQFFVYEI